MVPFSIPGSREEDQFLWKPSPSAWGRFFNFPNTDTIVFLQPKRLLMGLRATSFLFLLVFIFTAQQAAAYKKSDRKAAARVKADIYYLASDSLEGRRTGSEGERKAGDYIENRYKQLGIPPYKEHYRLPFQFPYGREAVAPAEVRIGKIILKQGDEVVLFPFSKSARVRSEVLPDILETGKVWLMPLYADSDEANNPHFEWEKTVYEKTRDAARQGAAAVLYYDAYGSKFPPEFNRQSEYETVDIPVAFLTNRAYNKYIADDKYEEYISDGMAGLPVEMNIAIRKVERTGTNIAAFIDNKAPYTVVIGAHYDHLGYGEDGNSLYAGKDKSIHNGADDNASGTAAVLEMAAQISKKRKKLHHYNYLFLNFSGEELGLLGSKAFVKETGLDSTRVAYMINIDMVGRLNDSTHALTIGGIGTSPAWAQFLAKPNKEFKIVVDSSGIGPSDHTSFYNAGIPVLFFFTGLHSDYHKPSDDADKINYPGEVAVINYMDEIVAQLETEPKPGYTVTKAPAIGKTKFKVTLGIMPDYTFNDGGVRVDGVTEGKPAIRAGVKIGDIIVQLGDYKVQGMQTYMEALGKFASGDKTTVTVMREGKTVVLPIEFSTNK